MSRDADPRLAHHQQILSGLRTKRSTFENQWEEAAERLIPAHVNSFFGRGQSNALTPGRKNATKMYDATASLALSRFAAVFESITTPKGQRYQELVPEDEGLRKNRSVRLYFEKLTDILFRHRYRPGAGFMGQQHKALQGFGAYGNGYMFVDEDPVRPGTRYKNLHLGETYMVENHQGIVDTMYRSFWLEPHQIADEYGVAALPSDVARSLNGAANQRTEYEILHVVRPRRDRDVDRIDTLGMAYESLHFFVKEGVLLRESGYRTFPLMLARYSQFTNESYGRGPAQQVLPAIKVLNEEKKAVIKQGHRAVDPVLLMHDNAVAGTFSLMPGAMNPGGLDAQGRPLVQPLPVGNLAVGQEMMNDERAVINDAFLITLFQILVETPQMTATEVLERAREKGVLLAPTSGRFESEYMDPLTLRELDVLDQQGLLPAPPPILAEAGFGYELEYNNPLSRMARAEKASGFFRALTQTLEMVQITQDPSPLDWFDTDAATPEIIDIAGAPISWTRTVEQVQEIRANREQERQEQKAIEAGPAVAALAKVEQDKNR